VTSVEGEEMIHRGLPEERLLWRKRFQAQYFDLRGKSIFTRFDVLSSLPLRFPSGQYLS
jgi:hypothetical protein